MLMGGKTSINVADLKSLHSKSKEVLGLRCPHCRQPINDNRLLNAAKHVRQENFEFSTSDDNEFRSAVGSQNAREVVKSSPHTQQHTALNLSKQVEKESKHFDDKLEFKSNGQSVSTPMGVITRGMVAGTLVNFSHEKSEKNQQMDNYPSEDVFARITNDNAVSRQSNDPLINKGLCKISELKRIYEPIEGITKGIKNLNLSSPKISESKSSSTTPINSKIKRLPPILVRPGKVKEIARMYDNKFTDIVNGNNNKRCKQLQNKLVEDLSRPRTALQISLLTNANDAQVAKTDLKQNLANVPIQWPGDESSNNDCSSQVSSQRWGPMWSPRSKRKLERPEPKSDKCLISPAIFNILSIKDKILLFTKLIEGLTSENSQFEDFVKLLEQKVQNQLGQCEVVSEEQKTVKRLKTNSEAVKCTASQVLVSSKDLPCKQQVPLETANESGEDEITYPVECAQQQLEDNEHIEEERLYVSQLLVQLKLGSKNKTKPKKRTNVHQGPLTSSFEGLTIVEDRPQKHRNQTEIPIEANEPPQKKLLLEQVSINDFFDDASKARLFYKWMKEKFGIDLDTTTNAKPTNANYVDFETPQGTTSNETQKISVDCLSKNTLKSCESEASMTEATFLEESDKPSHANVQPPSPLENTSEASTTTESAGSSTDQADNESKPSTAKVIDKLQNIQKCVDTSVGKEKMDVCRKRWYRSLPWNNAKKSVSATHNIHNDQINQQQMQQSQRAENNRSIYFSGNAKRRRHDMTSSFCKTDSEQTVDSNAFPDTQHPQKQDNQQELKMRSMLRSLNSRNKIRSAYTLTTMSSPSPFSGSDSYESELPNILDLSSTIRFRSSVATSIQNEGTKNQSSSPITERQNINVKPENQHNQCEPSALNDIQCETSVLTDSNVDQGFESASNNTKCSELISNTSLNHTKIGKETHQEKPSPPLSSKLYAELNKAFLRHSSFDNERNTPLGHSTPKRRFEHPNGFINYTNGITSPDFSYMAFGKSKGYEPNTWPHSPSLEAILEDHPLDTSNIHDTSSQNHNPELANEPTTPQYWISTGDFKISMKIFQLPPGRLHFSHSDFQKHMKKDSDLHFGIDENRFSVNNSEYIEQITESLPRKEGCSQYWFSTGDKRVSFYGNYMGPDEVKIFFSFVAAALKGNKNRLRFGIDELDFFNIAPCLSNKQKVLKGKHDTPEAMNNTKISDIDRSEFESDDTSRRTSPQAFVRITTNFPHALSDDHPSQASTKTPITPDLFSAPYNRERIDLSDMANLKICDMLKILQHQKAKMNSAEDHIYVHLQEALLAGGDMEYFIGLSLYVFGIHSIIRSIDNVGKQAGINAESIGDLKSFIVSLSNEAANFLSSSYNYMDRLSNSSARYRQSI